MASEQIVPVQWKAPVPVELGGGEAWVVTAGASEAAVEQVREQVRAEVLAEARERIEGVKRPRRFPVPAYDEAFNAGVAAALAALSEEADQ